MVPSIIEMIIKGSEKVKLQFLVVKINPLLSLRNTSKLITSLTIIIYLNRLDPSIPLQSETISQEAIVPGTSQEQQHNSKLTEDCFRGLDYHLDTNGTHQNPTAPFSSI